MRSARANELIEIEPHTLQSSRNRGSRTPYAPPVAVRFAGRGAGQLHCTARAEE
jgi:hypothetical protein